MHLYITTSTAKESHDTPTVCNGEKKNFFQGPCYCKLMYPNNIYKWSSKYNVPNKFYDMCVSLST